MKKQGDPPPLPEAKYPEITKLLETEDFDRVNKDFASLYESLEKIGKGKGMKRSADARKGMRAVEKTMDLLRELLKRKYELEEMRKKR